MTHAPQTPSHGLASDADGPGALAGVENGAQICRVTCGWKLPHLDLAKVRPYWRDAHSPAIARRPGIYEYRHYPLDPVQPDLFGPVADIVTDCPPDAQLMWLSDVRYANDAAVATFAASPPPTELAKMLADINLIVDRSTTYRVLGANGRTFADHTGIGAPCGPPASPTYGVFFRARGPLAAFQQTMRDLARAWATAPGLRRLRLSLFETPDMEAERRAGYPVKTHPVHQQYQAWIDLMLDDASSARGLLASSLAANIAAVHAYPAPAIYTFNKAGRPTLAGLRGYPAVRAIAALGADNQRDQGLLNWMYGAVADGVGH